MWCIQATLTGTDTDGWSGMVQVPTFYLLESVQGFNTQAGAVNVATSVIMRSIVSFAVEFSDLEVSVQAHRICDEPS